MKRWGAGDLRNRFLRYRPAESKDDFKDVIRGWEPADGPHWMAIERDAAAGGLRDNGPGEQRTAAARGGCYAQVDVRARDVLKVTDGPERGTLWQVVASFDAGGGKRDLSLDAYTGTPP